MKHFYPDYVQGTSDGFLGVNAKEASMAMIWVDITPLEGLELTGQGSAARGHVVVSTGGVEVKNYAFRRRMKDGRVTCRIGRLTAARACYSDGKILAVVFEALP
jgi:hypothetical protein